MLPNKREIQAPSKRKIKPKKWKSRWKKIRSLKRSKSGLSKKNNSVNLLITEATRQTSWWSLSFLLIRRITNFTMFYVRGMRKINLTIFTFQVMQKMCWMTKFWRRKVESWRTGKNSNVKVWANLLYSNLTKFQVRSSGFCRGALIIL